ncbi:MAG: hypothetical protein K6G80_03920 [Treponema sp.]|nr:hypothetical protein [Treponema sp.]
MHSSRTPFPAWRNFVYRKLFAFSLLLFLGALVPAADGAGRFTQKLSWKADAYALSYQVEIQTNSGGAVQTLSTEQSSVEVSLPAGNYRYRVTACDILGREASVSEWTPFEILKAASPSIAPPASVAALSEDGHSLALPLAIGSVTADSVVQLVNVETGKTVSGSLVLTDSALQAASGSETQAASMVQFKNVSEGRWRLRVTNPSGLQSESDVFTVKDEIKEKRLAAEKAEKERREQEELQRKEEERLAEERAKAEQAEKERMAAEKERIAAEKAAQEQAEKERLAAEKAAQEQAEKERLLAEKEAAQAEKKEKRALSWKNSRDIQLVAGAGITASLGDSLISDYYDDLPLSATVRISSLPVHVSRQKIGFEFFLSAWAYAKSTAYYESDLAVGVFGANFVYQYPLYSDRLYVSAKAGCGFSALRHEISYSGGESTRDEDTSMFGYGTVQGGLSCFWIPALHLACEAGFDAVHLLTADAPAVFVTPYIGVGLRF